MARARFCDPCVMRNAIIALGVLVVTAAVVVGVLQARNNDSSPPVAVLRPLSLAQVSRPLADTPPDLAALRRRVNELRPGGAKALTAQLIALRGHPVVVNLWASWCRPCIAELPIIQRQAVKRGAQVAFLGVNSGDNRGDAHRLTTRIPLPYPSFEDPRQVVAGEYEVAGLPSTAFFDARGQRVIHQGPYASEAQLSADIERYAIGAAGP
jgi:cytochrome c biogenesis protein CcmG, thiol:disulfide interchange protein DsbE